VSRRSGLSEPTLRYYEEARLVGPIDRDASSGHRRYRAEDLHTLEALACLRATGVGIEGMRAYRRAELTPFGKITVEGVADRCEPRVAGALHRGTAARPAQLARASA